MSIVEIILIIGAGLVPIIALIAVKPRLKKRLIPPETMPYVSSDKENEEKKNLTVEEKQPKEKVLNDNITSADFKDYLNHKRARMSVPHRNILPDNYVDRTMPYDRDVEEKENKKESVSQQINSLSPELLAMILSGALDRKYFD